MQYRQLCILSNSCFLSSFFNNGQNSSVINFFLFRQLSFSLSNFRSGLSGNIALSEWIKFVVLFLSGPLLNPPSLKLCTKWSVIACIKIMFNCNGIQLVCRDNRILLPVIFCLLRRCWPHSTYGLPLLRIDPSQETLHPPAHPEVSRSRLRYNVCHWKRLLVLWGMNWHSRWWLYVCNLVSFGCFIAGSRIPISDLQISNCALVLNHVFHLYFPRHVSCLVWWWKTWSYFIQKNWRKWLVNWCFVLRRYRCLRDLVAFKNSKNTIAARAHPLVDHPVHFIEITVKTLWISIQKIKWIFSWISH